MRRRNKTELRDIYWTGGPDLEQDYTPQIADQLVAERQRDLRKSQFLSIFLGICLIAVAIALIGLVVKDYIETTTRPLPPEFRGEEAKLPLFFIPAFEIRSTAGAGEFSPGRMAATQIKEAAYQIAMGQRATAAGNPPQALDHYLKAVELFPALRGIQQTIGHLYLRANQPEAAIQHLEQALLEEDLYQTRIDLGTACIQIKAFDRAETHLLRALAMRPEDPQVYRHLALLYLDMGNHDESLGHFEKYLELRPGDLDTMQTYALFLTETKRWAKAIDVLLVLTRETPAVAPAHFLLAQAFAQTGRTARAIESLEAGIALVDPALARSWLRRSEFDPLRPTEEFRQIARRIDLR